MGSNLKHEWHELRTTADAWQLRPDEISPSALRRGCFSWLSIEEQARCEQFRSERLRHEYLAARVLCRATLSRYADVDPSHWSFGASLHGKPKIIRPADFKSLRFNLAHTSGLVICLVSRAGEVGVDTEETSRLVDIAQVARHFLSCREQARLENLPTHLRVVRFFEQWVLREAYLKGIGKGIASAPERFTIKLGENDQPLPIRHWQFFLCRPSAKHVAAAAVRQRRGAAPVSVRWLKADDLFSWRPKREQTVPKTWVGVVRRRGCTKKNDTCANKHLPNTVKDRIYGTTDSPLLSLDDPRGLNKILGETSQLDQY